MGRDLANCRIFAVRMNGGGPENAVEWILLSVKGGNYAFGFPIRNDVYDTTIDTRVPQVFALISTMR